MEVRPKRRGKGLRRAWAIFIYIYMTILNTLNGQSDTNYFLSLPLIIPIAGTNHIIFTFAFQVINSNIKTTSKISEM